MHWNFFTGKLDFHKDSPIHEWVSMSLFSRSTSILAERGCSQFTSHYRVHSQLSSHFSLYMVLGLSALRKEIVSTEDVKLLLLRKIQWRHLIQPCWWCHSCYPISWTTFYTRPCVLYIHPLVFKIESSKLEVNPKPKFVEHRGCAKHPKCPNILNVQEFLCQFKKNNLSLYTHPIRRRQWNPTPVLLPGKSHGRRSLVGYSPWGCKELDTTERLNFHFSLSWPGEGNGSPLQCSCRENPRDRGAWWAAVYGVAESRTQLTWLSSSSSTYPILL